MEDQKLIFKVIGSNFTLVDIVYATIEDGLGGQIGNPILLQDLVQGSRLRLYTTFIKGEEDYPKQSPNKEVTFLVEIVEKSPINNEPPETGKTYSIYKKNYKTMGIKIAQTSRANYMDLLYISNYIIKSFTYSR